MQRVAVNQRRGDIECRKIADVRRGGGRRQASRIVGGIVLTVLFSGENWKLNSLKNVGKSNG